MAPESATVAHQKRTRGRNVFVAILAAKRHMVDQLCGVLYVTDTDLVPVPRA
jgi:hypothetical protein